jgi:hypothetical protein
MWRWMKEEIKRLLSPPTTLEDLKREVQRLWDLIDPKDFHCFTKRLTVKLEDVIEVKGATTVH